MPTFSLLCFLAFRCTAKNPIFVGPLEGDTKQLLLKAWDNATKVRKVMGDKVMWIATANDPYSLLIKMPTPTEFKRLVCLARAAIKLASQVPTSKHLGREIFTLQLSQFDCLILTTPPRDLITKISNETKGPTIRKNLPASNPLRSKGSVFDEDSEVMIFPQKGHMLQEAFELAYSHLQSNLQGACLLSRNSWLYPYAMMVGLNVCADDTRDTLVNKIHEAMGDFVHHIVFKEENLDVWRRAKEQLSIF
eukprot:Blabericola_migrator_1__1611@NODE_1429_length_4558_cov_54_174349_g950_i0_p3_GENE_NODE_1429_length_4558_cov_54_174349_g950_i0NODE_1429_length_4558_cov_54_174349_g950_i0_p3_ORF_typecomplete_len249_score41_83Nrap_D5/PF17406_2/1_3e05_NODE_1429_length_4558_cov_54_174349_g950_i037104456